MGSSTAQKRCITSAIGGEALTANDISDVCGVSFKAPITTHPRWVLITKGSSYVCIISALACITARYKSPPINMSTGAGRSN